MSAVQQRYRDSFLRFCPGADRVSKLALQFRAMLRWRRTSRLAQWIATVTSSGFSFLAQFARTLRRDLGAVELAIETALEQRTDRGPDQPTQSDQTSDVWACWLRASESSSAALVGLTVNRMVAQVMWRV
jgi:hypothetical protein